MLGQLSRFQHQLLAWYASSRRDLPWRTPRDAEAAGLPDPYHVLVSEAMLQQTQVVTVIPYFHRFLAQFPTLDALAQAEEQAVLRCWQGLGYYTRARNLQAAARKIVAEFDGVVPDNPKALLTIPGIGPYTAGAIASLAYDRRAPILDGNVARVLCRIDKVESDPREKRTVALLWARAEEILPTEQVGDFNSALMELGATVCTPRNPQCLICPVRAHCEAAAAGVQQRIPLPRKSKQTPLERRWTFVIRFRDKYLIEQRPARGRWAGMWQFITIPSTNVAPDSAIRTETGLLTHDVEPLITVTHALTHRRYEFLVYATIAQDDALPSDSARRWVSLAELHGYPLPRPHVKILLNLKPSDNGGALSANGG